MRGLAVLIGVGWLGFGFYAVGPLTTHRQIVVAGCTLVAGCLLSAAMGAWLGWPYRTRYASRVMKSRPPERRPSRTESRDGKPGDPAARQPDVPDTPR